MKKRLTAWLLAVMMLMLSGCSEAVSLTTLPDQRESVDAFFTYLKNEDYDGADDLVYNYATLGMKTVTANESDSDAMVDKLLGDYLRESRSYTVENVGEMTGRDTTVDISYTYLDYRKISEPLNRRVTSEIKERKFAGEKFEDDASVMPVMVEQLQKLMEASGSDLMTTEQYKLELRYREKKWRIVVTEEFYQGLIGYAV